jgi:hypothetical protein
VRQVRFDLPPEVRSRAPVTCGFHAHRPGARPSPPVGAKNDALEDRRNQGRREPARRCSWRAPPRASAVSSVVGDETVDINRTHEADCILELRGAIYGCIGR